MCVCVFMCKILINGDTPDLQPWGVSNQPFPAIILVQKNLFGNW